MNHMILIREDLKFYIREDRKRYGMNRRKYFKGIIFAI